MERRTLYLDAKKGLVLRLDGPSLWIEERGRAGRRVPARLIGQAVIRGSVRMDAGVITMLAAEGVPISFIGHDGTPAVVTLPAQMPPSVFHERVDRLRGSAGASAMVARLFSSTRKTLATRFIREFVPSMGRNVLARGLREGDYLRAQEKAMQYPGAAEAAGVARPVVSALFHELTLRTVIDVGLDPHRGFLHGGRDFALVKDFLHAIEPESERHVLRFARSRAITAFVAGAALTRRGYANIVVRFENSKKRTTRLLDALLDGFFEIMRRPFP
jgi:CRISPR/Cas system-associated endonuclease Cas1